MGNTTLGPLFALIGQLAAQDIGVDPDGMLLYAEAEPGVVSCALFQDVGDRIIYRHGSGELDRKLMDAWYAEDPDKRWALMIYNIKDSKFELELKYPDQINKTEDDFERRDRYVFARFGKKPIDYSDPEPR